MAILKKSEIEIPLNGGMNTSAGAEYQSVETMRNVENLRINADGEYEKRPRHTAYSLAMPSGTPYGTVPEVSGVYTRGRDVFALTGDHGVARLDGSTFRYSRRSVLTSASPDAALRYSPVSCSVERKFLDRSQLSKAQQAVGGVASAVYNSETLVVAWTTWDSSASATLYIKAYNLETGALKLEEQTVSLGATAYLTQISAIELLETSKLGVLITVGITSAAPMTIRAYRWDAATNEVVFDSNLTTNASGVKHTIAASASNRFYFAFEDNTSGVLIVQDRSTTAVTTTHTATHGALGGCAIVKGANRTLIASVDGASSFYGSTLYAEVFGTPASAITLRTVAGTAGNDWLSGCHVALETRSDVTDAAVVYGNGVDMTYAPVSVVTSSPHFVSYHFVDFSATTAVDQRNGWIPNATCTGAAQVDGRAHGVFILNPDRVQTTPVSLVVARASCPVYASPDRHDVVARVAHERFSQYLVDYFADSDSVSVVGKKMHFVLQADPTNTKPQSLFHATVDFTPKPMPYVDLGDGTTLFGGGTLHQFDGAFPCEAQPIDKPTVYLENTGTGTGELTGTISAIAVYSFIDAAGKLHRSAPSVPVSIDLTSDRYDAFVSALPFSAYDGNTAPLYNVELYVTDTTGSGPYYRANSSTDFLVYTTVDSKGTFFKFTTGPEGSASFPQVYTDGSAGAERASTPPPAFSSLWRVGDLVFGLDAEDPTRVWHTKPLVAGYAPEWSNLNTVTIGDRGVGGADVGGQTVVFGERGMWYIGGQGPNAAGGGGFDVPRRLPHEVESLDPLSICKTSVGVLFRCRRGVYLLDTGLAIQPVSAPIDGDLTATRDPTGYCKVAFDELMGEAHMLDFGGDHWVFNVGENKWMRWTQDVDQNYWADVAVLGGQVYWVSRDTTGDTLARDYSIDESDYRLTYHSWELELPWIRFDGVTGNMRVKELIVQVRLGSPIAEASTLQVTYSTRDGGDERWSWSGADLAALGDSGDTVNLRCPISNQRTRQFKVTINDIVSGEDFTSHVPIAMRVHYAVTPGGERKKTQGQLKGSTSVS